MKINDLYTNLPDPYKSDYFLTIIDIGVFVGTNKKAIICMEQKPIKKYPYVKPPLRVFTVDQFKKKITKLHLISPEVRQKRHLDNNIEMMGS